MRVVLTGGASGIGAAAAAKLKAQGALVLCVDRSEPAAHFDRWIKADLSDPDAVTKAADQIEGAFDALINCAGLPPRQGLEETILAVNYFGLVAFTNALVPKLKRGAAIVNMASRAGARWRENLSQIKALMALDRNNNLAGFIADQKIEPAGAYDLSKEAVIVWTMAQTERFIGLGLRANTVSPAAVDTAILGDFIAAFGDRAHKMIARIGRPGTADEIADLICFLAGPQSAWIRGADIAIDGGASALVSTDPLDIKG